MADVVRTEELRRLAPAALTIFVLTAVYFASAWIGLRESVVVAGAVVTPLWPPTGIALSSLLLLGMWTWPGIALGTLAIVATLSPLDVSVLGVMAGNTLAPVCACLMLRKVGFRVELDRLRDGVALVALGAFAGMLISATVGSGTQVLTGSLPTGGFWRTWAAWWVGDAMGVLVVTPSSSPSAPLGGPTASPPTAGPRRRHCWSRPSSCRSWRPGASSPCSSWSFR
ncbi:MASE1 domain-containing protein [Streptomyces sirii]|uniref:MASE1 domain-containing protein n=1 Tax=Streptomyces sirii TaxID=3127701 RepID=UPI003D35B981